MDAVSRGQAEGLDKLAEAIKALPGDRAAALEALMERQAYSVQETADMLGVSTSTIWRAIRNGDIRSFRIGTNERAPVRIAATELLRILQGDNDRGGAA